jgi:Arsenical resistance operon protein ArsD
MRTLTVYDPPMCCATGVCGPEVDPKLARFAGDLDWLKAQGVKVERINLAQEPGRFAENRAVKAVLDRSGGDELPAILVGDELVATGRYPGRHELAAVVDLPSGAATELAEERIGEPGQRAAGSSCCGGRAAAEQKSAGCC